MAKKSKAPPPRPLGPGRTPQTTGEGSPHPAALGMAVMRNLIPMGSPMTGDATQIRSETAKRKGRSR